MIIIAALFCLFCCVFRTNLAVHARQQQRQNTVAREETESGGSMASSVVVREAANPPSYSAYLVATTVFFQNCSVGVGVQRQKILFYCYVFE